MAKTIRVALVAGELSGSELAYPLMRHLRLSYPDIVFCGIGTPEMVEEGFDCWWDSHDLAVMGFNVGKHLKRLLCIHYQLYRRLLSDPPDLFIGIDLPDFNFAIEKKLKKKGIPVVHVVSPSLWAWRKNRLYGLHHIMDLMIILFPFERAIYAQSQVPYAYAPHPLFHQMPMMPDRDQARRLLGLNEKATLITLMPGSRFSEVSLLLPTFLSAAERLWSVNPHLYFIVPMATKTLYEYCVEWLRCFPIRFAARILLLLGKSHIAMTAADVVVVASGTATLECALLKRPMVICYDLKPFSAWIVTRLVKTPWVGLANIFVQESLFPELLLGQCTPEAIVQAVDRYLSDPIYCRHSVSVWEDLHADLMKENPMCFAQSVEHILQRGGFLPQPA